MALGSGAGAREVVRWQFNCETGEPFTRAQMNAWHWHQFGRAWMFIGRFMAGKSIPWHTDVLIAKYGDPRL